MKHGFPFEGSAAPSRRAAGYLLTEAMVYLSVVIVVLAVAFAAMYSAINTSLSLRRGAGDISRTLSVGELWRADVRAARMVRLEETTNGTLILVEGDKSTNHWRIEVKTVRRKAAAGPWIPVLENVRSCRILEDPRKNVRPWRMEIELVTRNKNSRVRPLFTFIGVPQSPLSK